MLNDQMQGIAQAQQGLLNHQSELARDLGALGVLGGGGAAGFSTITVYSEDLISIEQKMQREVTDWLKDWDKEND